MIDFLAAVEDTGDYDLYLTYMEENCNPAFKAGSSETWPEIIAARALVR